MKVNPEIFKAYDVRGVYPEQLDEKTAFRIGEAYAATRNPKKVAVGQDVRASGGGLKKALIKGLLSSGIDVIDIGVITTDQLYFAVGNYGYDGGISVTASHNPREYNGFKFAEVGGGPISSQKLLAIRDWAASNKKNSAKEPGRLTNQEIIQGYIHHVLSYIDPDSIMSIKLVANANFGVVGRGMDILAKKINLDIEKLNWNEDGTFPKGPPNPLIPSSRDETSKLIKKVKADLGVAWDADADRCFFFTGQGKFIPSCFIIALLAQKFLDHYPGSKIVHDVAQRWVVDDAIQAGGGQPVVNRVGHTFIKARMREEDAPFAAESSGHYYFRDSFYADNGIVPLLLILEMISKSGKSLDELTAPLMSRYFVADETNFEVSDPLKAIQAIEDELGEEGEINRIDGVAIESKQWRINLRPSNTEPLIRLNAEAKSQSELDKLMRRVKSLINT